MKEGEDQIAAKAWLKTFIILAIIALILFVFIFIKRTSMSFLPKGEFLRESTSPNGDYIIKAYLSSPALSCSAVRCEVINNETGAKRNIYWEYEEYRAIIHWVDDETVRISPVALCIVLSVMIDR